MSLVTVLVVVALTRSTSGPPPSRWRADLDEQFDLIAPTTWNVEDNTFASNESSYHLARNVSTRSGVLRLRAKPESAGGRQYTSGRLNTNGRYALPNYFRAEVRAKVPFEQGLWAAPLWFRPTNGGPGEIDLVETYGSEADHPLVHQSIHTAYGPRHREESVARPFSTFTSKPAGGWHTYTVEKTPGRIRMWVDGKLSSEFTASSVPWFDRYYEAGRRWNLRVNLQVGGSYGLPDASTSWSSDHSVMQLDYVRTWVPE
ncbi:MAG: glycoside hydrolase family 16 protein [Aeromicrobium sp.]